MNTLPRICASLAAAARKCAASRLIPHRLLIATLIGRAAIPAAQAIEQLVPLPLDASARASINLTYPGLKWDGLGFIPVAVLIENHVSASRNWQITFDVNEQGGMGAKPGGLHSTFQFTVEPDATLDTVVFVPGPGVIGQGAPVEVQGTVDGPGAQKSKFTLLNPSRPGSSTIAVSPQLNSELQTWLGVLPGTSSGFARTPSMNNGRGMSPVTLELGTVEANRWPADWRTWSPYSVVVLGVDEFGALDAARRSALRDWVALGGQLVLAPIQTQAATKVESVGLGRIVTLPDSLAVINRQLAASAKTDSDAYDKVVADYKQELQIAKLARASGANPTSNQSLPPPKRPQPKLPGQLDNLKLADGTPFSLYLVEAGQRTSPPWFNQFFLLTDHDAAKWIVEKHPISLVIGLLVFALLVGPVNFTVFAPAGRRHRLFLTVPALSLLASLGLGVMIVVGDGFGGEGTRRALVVLLPAENKAAVFQEQVARTGVLMGGNFPLPDDTVAIKWLEPERGNRNDSAADLTRMDATASGGWFRSHLEQTQLFWRITPTRARVELVGGGVDGAAPIVQSTLATTLHDFVYVDAAGVSWTVASLPTGQRVTLQPDKIAWQAHPIAASLHLPPAPGFSDDDEMEYQGGGPASSFYPVVSGGGGRGSPTRAGRGQQNGPPQSEPEETPLRDPRERGLFYALGGASDLAPLATLASIRWMEESVIYTGRLETARTP